MSSPSSSHSTSTRDAALRRLSLSTRWLIAGSVALTGALSEAAAHAFPGKTVKVGAQSRKKHRRHHSSQGATSSLAPPATAPQAAPEAHVEPAPETHSEPAPEVHSEPAPEVRQEPAPEPAPEAPIVSGGS